MSTLSTIDTRRTIGPEREQREHRQGKGRSREVRHSRPMAERLLGYGEILSNHRRRLGNLAAIYREQPSVYPLQVEDTLRYLLELRRLAGIARTYLDRLKPSETQRLRPYGCIEKLASMDALLTELLLNVAMFAQVCQCVVPERVQVHMEIRAKFLALLLCHDDLLALLLALVDKAREEVAAPQAKEVQP